MSGLSGWLRRQGGDVARRHLFAAKEPSFGGFGMADARIAAVLRARGVGRLYSHQSLAAGLAASGRDVVVTTPTASGKTLCYNLPVLDALLKNDETRALYIFPTKALAQDQLAELSGFTEALGIKSGVMVYDGDTPTADRRRAPESGVIITNPDMIHVGILPRHALWADFFKNLRYIVVDELHAYRGVFGSHVSNLFARLLRVCAYYGAKPVFICCSATTANPAEHAKALTGRDFAVIDKSGAPTNEKEFIIYRPKLLDSRSGLRRSSMLDTADITSGALCGGISTIVFTRSRRNVELLLAAVQKRLAANGEDPNIVTGYRCGYLPLERRETERRLRSGELRGVVCTNALELGIDIGSLDLAVLHGYPGSVASALQQAGRAGRRSSSSAAIMVASASPLDHFIAANPQWLIGASPEEAMINPTNDYIRVGHVRCAAAELTFREGEEFAGCDISAILEHDTAHGLLSKENTPAGTFYHWLGGSTASAVSLRNADKRIYTITESGSNRQRIIGTMDGRSAPRMLFPGAVYFHNGRSYIVEKLDTDACTCEARLAVTDYFTECRLSLRVQVREEIESNGLCGWGGAVVASSPCMYVKLSTANRAMVGRGDIDLPEERIETTVCWFTAPEETRADKDISAALTGFANLLRNAAPLFLMCARDDIDVFVRMGGSHVSVPAVFIADTVPGGAGLAEGAFQTRVRLLFACLAALDNCKCRKGCPACSGVSDGADLKSAARRLLTQITKHI